MEQSMNKCNMANHNLSAFQHTYNYNAGGRNMHIQVAPQAYQLPYQDQEPKSNLGDLVAQMATTTNTFMTETQTAFQRAQIPSLEV